MIENISGACFLAMKAHTTACFFFLLFFLGEAHTKGDDDDDYDYDGRQRRKKYYSTGAKKTNTSVLPYLLQYFTGQRGTVSTVWMSKAAVAAACCFGCRTLDQVTREKRRNREDCDVVVLWLWLRARELLFLRMSSRYGGWSICILFF